MSPESLKEIYNYNMKMLDTLDINNEDKLEWLLNLKSFINNYKENIEILQEHWLKTKKWQRYEESEKKKGK